MNAFLLDNILLIAIICVCVVSLAWPYVAKRRWGPEVDNRSATELINHKNAQIVDLRDPADRIQNELGKLDKTRPVLLVDDDGRRSRMASPLLRGTGFKEVFILAGGLNAWRTAKLPFSR